MCIFAFSELLGCFYNVLFVACFRSAETLVKILSSRHNRTRYLTNILKEKKQFLYFMSLCKFHINYQTIENFSNVTFVSDLASQHFIDQKGSTLWKLFQTGKFLKAYWFSIFCCNFLCSLRVKSLKVLGICFFFRNAKTIFHWSAPLNK